MTAAAGKVAVLMGGLSAEREVSLESGRAVLAALQRRGVDAHGIDADRNIIDVLQQGKFDRAFIMLHGPWGEDGVMQGALELVGMPYTGSGVLASALAMDKLRSRHLLRGAGIRAPDFMRLHGEEDFPAAIDRLGLPMAVKPNAQGSSVGIRKVKRAADLAPAWQQARALDEIVLAERWIDGLELHAAVLGDEVLPLVRVQAAGEFYDYAAKYELDSTRYHCPSGIDITAEDRIKATTREAFRLLGGRGWARLDFILDHSQEPYLLEMNTVPGMTTHSLVPMAARQAGLSFEDLVLRILESSDGHG